jgi:hypothetical protein
MKQETGGLYRMLREARNVYTFLSEKEWKESSW